MRRSLSGRILALALTLWLPLFMGGAEWAVRCPTHGGAQMDKAQGVASQSHAVQHDHGQSMPGDHGSRHQCSCPGPGCCPPAVAVVAVVTVPMARVVATHEATAVSTLDLFASDRDHVLPFSTAPPVA